MRARFRELFFSGKGGNVLQVNEHEATDFRHYWLAIDRLRKKQTSSGKPYALISKIAGNDQAHPANPSRHENYAD
jgi:hypothetical protein